MKLERTARAIGMIIATLRAAKDSLSGELGENINRGTMKVIVLTKQR
jgi:hypothetical protein